MATFSLDDIRAAADRKYGHTEIQIDEETTVRLVNALQLSKAERKALVAVQERLSKTDEENGEEQEDVLKDALRIVASDKKAIEKLLAQIGDNLALLVTVFTQYNEGTQAGEA